MCVWGGGNITFASAYATGAQGHAHTHGRNFSHPRPDLVLYVSEYGGKPVSDLELWREAYTGPGSVARMRRDVRAERDGHTATGYGKMEQLLCYSAVVAATAGGGGWAMEGSCERVIMMYEKHGRAAMPRVSRTGRPKQLSTAVTWPPPLRTRTGEGRATEGRSQLVGRDCQRRPLRKRAAGELTPPSRCAGRGTG